MPSRRHTAACRITRGTRSVGCAIMICRARYAAAAVESTRLNASANGVSLSTTGGIGRHIGKFDINEYYGPKRGMQS